MAHPLLFVSPLGNYLVRHHWWRRRNIVDPHTVNVDGKLYSAMHILISVGGHPFILEFHAREYAIDSDAALHLPSKPKKIAIVGRGYIALEFAAIFNALSSQVHVFICQKKVLRGFDEEVTEFVAEQMTVRGIEFHTKESPEAIVKAADGSLTLKTNKGTVDVFLISCLLPDVDPPQRT